MERGEAVERRGCERLVGRLANLSHVLPEMAPHLACGYAVASARVAPRRRVGSGAQRRRLLDEMRLRRGGRCEEAVMEMCGVAG